MNLPGEHRAIVKQIQRINNSTKKIRELIHKSF